MKFDVSRFKIKRQYPKSGIAAVVLLVFFAGLAAFTFIRSASLSEQIKKKDADLVVERSKVIDLTAKLEAKNGESATSLLEKTQQCTSDQAMLNDKVAAFAKQAAVCENLRQKLAQR